MAALWSSRVLPAVMVDPGMSAISFCPPADSASGLFSFLGFAAISLKGAGAFFDVWMSFCFIKLCAVAQYGC